ncbi:hypothetical protein ASZ86_03647 [Vibrio cholerae]|nr:hypothetical protein ASZ86_03647 [Vibrio cholerae]
MFKYALRKSMGRWVFFPICCVLIPVGAIMASVLLLVFGQCCQE